MIAGNGDAIFKRLMMAIDRVDLANDAQLERNDGRVARTAEIDQAIGNWTVRFTADEVLARLQAADVPVGKIYSVRDMLQDPQFLARQMFETHQFSDGSSVKLPAISPKLSETPGKTQWLGPDLGAHNREILRRLGYDAAQIDQLQKDGVI